RDIRMELWTGAIVGQKRAVSEHGFDQAFAIDDIDDHLPLLLQNRQQIFAPLGKMDDFDKQLMFWYKDVQNKIRQGVNPPGQFHELSHILHPLRWQKHATEIALMRKAAEISAQAHIRAMQMAGRVHYEYELEAELWHEFIRHGARYTAYDSIVAAGKNACVLHYTANDAKINPADLILIDAGCEYQHYAADITRTFPASGRFSGEQRAVYEIVLAAQHAAMALIKPGCPWNDLHTAAVRVTTQGLKDLDILHGDLDGLIEQAAYKDFYMHKSGHWLGMDVHDVGPYKDCQ
ncbi:unnamed protein product, partial [marine sediment metagenome]